MNGVDLLLAAAGGIVTMLTLAGMVLLTPRGVVEIHQEGTDSHGSNLAPVADKALDQKPVIDAEVPEPVLKS